MLAPFAATVIAVAHHPDDRVAPGTAVIVLEAMKMEHEVIAQTGGVVRRIEVSVGETVQEGQLLAPLEAGDGVGGRRRLRRSRRPISTSRATISRRSASATGSASTRRAPTRSPSATSEATGPPARTSTTSSTRHVRRVRAADLRRPGTPALQARS